MRCRKLGSASAVLSARKLQWKNFIRSMTSSIDSTRGLFLRTSTWHHVLSTVFYNSTIPQCSGFRFEDYVEQESKRLDDFRPPDYGPKFEEFWAKTNWEKAWIACINCLGFAFVCNLDSSMHVIQELNQKVALKADKARAPDVVVRVLQRVTKLRSS